MSYLDIRCMPIRYRAWYIDRYIQSINAELEQRQKMINDTNNKTSRSF